MLTPQQILDQLIQDIRDAVAAGDVRGGQGWLLELIVEIARARVDQGLNAAAIRWLNVFTGVMNFLVIIGQIDPAVAEPLLTPVTNLIATLAPIPRTDTFAFTLPAGSLGVVVGPVLAGNGSLEVALNFSGDFIILACVGTQSSCIPMGGRPQTRTFNIPSDFPAGAIQATVYFNPNFPQPPGDASGTVNFTYVPL